IVHHVSIPAVEEGCWYQRRPHHTHPIITPPISVLFVAPCQDCSRNGSVVCCYIRSAASNGCVRMVIPEEMETSAWQPSVFSIPCVIFYSAASAVCTLFVCIGWSSKTSSSTQTATRTGQLNEGKEEN